MWNTSKYREFIKFPLRLKLFNTKKLLQMRECQSKGPSPTTMQLRPRLSISEEKSKKLSWFKNPFREFTIKFNTFPFKLKSYTTLKEITTCLLPPKLELNMWEFRAPRQLQDKLWADTKLIREGNKEAELGLELISIVLIMLGSLQLPIKLAKLVNQQLRQATIKHSKPIKLGMANPKIRQVAIKLEAEPDKEDMLVAAVELEERHTVLVAMWNQLMSLHHTTDLW